MKRYIFIALFFFACFYINGQQLPLSKIAPHRTAYYQEGTGKAIVNNVNLTYWLYQSTPNDMYELIKYLHSYVESIGYTIDFDSFSGAYENPRLATSVRNLMNWQKRNVSVTISDNILIINIDTEEKGPLADRMYLFMSWDLVKG